MKNLEKTNSSFKAFAVVLIIGLTIIYNSNYTLKRFKGEFTHNLQTDTTQQKDQNETNSGIELLSFTTKLFVSGVKQFISTH